ncbi:MAG: hypothetical protein M1820_009061 [Bogoriella megaspora]|nr:MAG: hypothetical protein M1820_009061 [Bogoriella megaspora]
MAQTLYQRIRLDPNVAWVNVNRVGITWWPPHGTSSYLATYALNGCTGVAIVSPQAGILAHVAPLDPNNPQGPATENLRQRMQEMVYHFNTNIAYFTTSQSMVLAAVHERAEALPDAIDSITRTLAQLGLPLFIRGYPVIPAGTPRPPGTTAIVIQPRTPAQMPLIYVNDQIVYPST